MRKTTHSDGHVDACPKFNRKPSLTLMQSPRKQISEPLKNFINSNNYNKSKSDTNIINSICTNIPAITLTRQPTVAFSINSPRKNSPNSPKAHKQPEFNGWLSLTTRPAVVQIPEASLTIEESIVTLLINLCCGETNETELVKFKKFCVKKLDFTGAEITEFFKQNYEFDDQSLLGDDILKKDRRKTIKKISKSFIEHEGIIIENDQKKLFLNQKYRVNGFYGGQEVKLLQGIENKDVYMWDLKVALDVLSGKVLPKSEATRVRRDTINWRAISNPDPQANEGIRIHVSDTGKKRVLAGSLEKFIEYLTTESQSSFRDTFILTCCTFTTPQRLIELLIDRWTGKKKTIKRGRHKKQVKESTETTASETADTSGKEISSESEKEKPKEESASAVTETSNDQKKQKEVGKEEEKEKKAEKTRESEEELQKKKAIQLKILNFVKMWIENVPETFVDTINYLSLQNLLQKMKTDDKNTTSVSHLQEILENLLKKHFMKVESTKVTINFKNGSEIEGSALLDVDHVILAQQLTLIDYDIFSKITTLEILQKNWNSACWIVTLSNRFNDLSSWFSCQILQIQLEKRKLVLSYLIKLLDSLFKIKNYFSSMCLLSVLESTPISRLSRTWEKITPNEREIIEEIKQQLTPSHNFTNYRKLLRDAKPPCLPFIGMYLRDIIYIDDGNPDFISGLINFQKRTYLAKIIMEIKHFQVKPYNFPTVPDLANKLSCLKRETSETLAKLSVKVEPDDPEGYIEILLQNKKALRDEITDLESKLTFLRQDFNRLQKENETLLSVLPSVTLS